MVGYDLFNASPNEYFSSFGYTQFPQVGGNVPQVALSPLVHDRQVQIDSGNAAGYDLQAFIGNSYFLRRIVGKVVCAVRNAVATAGAPTHYKCAAAFFVARADEDEANNPIGLPVGGVTAADAGDNYNPLRADQMVAPWIWRRTWILQNELQAASGGGSAGNFGFSASNTLLGSMYDGPHVDAKTKRYVQRNERLYLATAVQSWPNPQEANAVNAAIQWDIDLRYFGTPLKARNDGAF